MTQFINYNDKGEVMVYHTNPSKAGTPDFEHKGYVKLKSLKHQRKEDGSDNLDMLEIGCPVPGCDTICWVPITGDAEAKELHRKTKDVKTKL